MRRYHFAIVLSTACFWAASTAALDLDALTSPVLHVWEKLEITLQASNAYANPYTDAQVWVDCQRRNETGGELAV